MTVYGRPTLADEFRGIDTRLSSMERTASALGAVLPMTPYRPGLDVATAWRAAATIPTAGIAHPVIRLDCRVSAKQGANVWLRLFDVDKAHAVTAEWQYTGGALNNGWVRLDWAVPTGGGQPGEWQRLLLQAKTDVTGGGTVDPGVAMALPFNQAPAATEAGTWTPVPLPPGYA
ncbi:hypothetical protein ACFWXO_19245 [Kitasatospora sp. NPDC059088]|uniref:hypothetical protein n=1 Tax=Kitasatospora sp. NPDC059088 TaxID=3346722 RepID=UPI0036A97D4F